MPFAEHIPGFPIVILQGDWTSPAAVLADIATGWGMEFRTDLAYFIVVWEGPTDPDDWALYTITNGNTLAVSTPFVSTPTAEGTTLYITDIWFSSLQ